MHIVTVTPDPVQHLQSTYSTSTTITITWLVGFDGDESIESITVSYAASGNNVSASDGSITLGAVTTHTLVGLQPLTTYKITVVAVNDVGPSHPSTIISVETKPTSECS